VNNLGGCHGSTGPINHQPRHRQALGRGLPGGHGRGLGRMRRRAWPTGSASRRFAAVIGGSLGGMQAHAVGAVLPGARAPRPGDRRNAEAHGAEHRLQRGRPPGHPHRPGFPRRPLLRARRAAARGLRLARMLGHITYLSDDRWRRNSAAACASRPGSYGFDVEFEIESYLRYQGDKFAGYFDANTYLRMTKALDYFDPALDYGGDLRRRWPAPAPKLPGDLLHHRLALRARALARDRPPWCTTARTSPTPRSKACTATTPSSWTTRITTPWSPPT
jgi:homoserine O-acetyltransferase